MHEVCDHMASAAVVGDQIRKCKINSLHTLAIQQTQNLRPGDHYDVWIVYKDICRDIFKKYL